jgi:hypothetical protein
MNYGRDRELLVETVKREGRALIDSWMDEEFPMKMMMYLQKVAEKKK